MKKFRNVLSSETLSRVDVELEQKIPKNEWRNSAPNWPSYLQEGWPGITSISYASEEIAKEIEKDIKEFLPPYGRLCIQYYIWHPLSAINAHSDTNHLFGCTIYLNPTWHVNYGGLFVWLRKDQEDDEAACVEIPSRNTLILNDENEWHMVTPISPATPEKRLTIQIWGD